MNSKLPERIGDYVTTDDGLKGEVHSVSVLRQLVKVVVTVDKDEKEIREYRVDQLKFRPKRRKDKVQCEGRRAQGAGGSGENGRKIKAK